MERYYNIAGLVAKIYGTGLVVERGKAYECEQCDKVDIHITKNDIDKVARSWRENGLDHYDVNEDMEYHITGSLFYLSLMRFNGLMLHSSAVVVDDAAYLFSADPGTGKSTHTGLWLNQFDNRSYILNDDKPALRFEDGKWYAYGTPWSGKHDISVNRRVPLAGIAALERASKNTISPLSIDEAVTFFVKQINRSRNTANLELLLDLFEQLITQVPIWKLRCNMDPSAAIVSYEAMSGKYYASL